jgi:hypothetical protein
MPHCRSGLRRCISEFGHPRSGLSRRGPAISEITGAVIPRGLRLDGRSLVPLLKAPKAKGADRFVVGHAANQGGKTADHPYDGGAVRNTRFRFTSNRHLCDSKADPGETKDVSNEQPKVVSEMRAAYDTRREGVIADCTEREKSR